MPRIIHVPAEHKKWLDMAIASAITLGVRDVYEEIKKFLRGKNVPHKDEHIEKHQVPADRVYWHE